jgi:hypothetical protein
VSVPKLGSSLVILAGMVMAFLVEACNPLKPLPLSPVESSAISGGGSALVLLRLVGEDQEGARLDLFPQQNAGEFEFGIGGFDSGGEPTERPRRARALSTAARDEGWITFILPPGYYHFAYGKMNSTLADLGSYPHWRIEVPPRAAVVYAGTFHLSGTTGPRFLQGRGIFDFDQAATRVEDERELAAQIARRDLPTLPPPVTRLAVLGPLLLDMPPPARPSE